MNNNNGSERILYLDLAKFVGIICVIYGHVEIFGFGINGSVVTDLIYTFNMPLFFFVSGYLAFKTDMSSKLLFSNALKKFKMLLIPTIVFSLYWALVYMTRVDFLEGFGRYWFGCVLFECFVIYYTICMITTNNKQQIVLMIVLSIAGIGYLSTGVGDKYLEVIELNHLTKYLHFFTLGIFAKYFMKYYTRILDSEIIRTISIVLFFTLFFALRYDELFSTIVYHILNDIILRYLGLYICVMFLYEVSKKEKYNGNLKDFVELVAENSFGIYLLQYFFLPGFSGHKWLSNVDSLTIFIICTLFTLICTLVCIGVIAVLSKSNIICHYILGKR